MKIHYILLAIILVGFGSCQKGEETPLAAEVTKDENLELKKNYVGVWKNYKTDENFC